MLKIISEKSLNIWKFLNTLLGKENNGDSINKTKISVFVEHLFLITTKFDVLFAYFN